MAKDCCGNCKESKECCSVSEGYTLYTTDRSGRNIKKIKTYSTRKAAAIAMGKLMQKLDTPRFPKNVDGLSFVKESINEINGIQLAKKVVKNKQHEKGMDLFTAQYIVQTYDAYKKHPELRKKIEKLSVPKAVKLANLVMKGR